MTSTEQASAGWPELTASSTIVVDEHKGGWTYALLPGSRAVLGTGRAVKVRGTVDAVPIEATLMPSGDGAHMLPLRRAIVRALGKAAGDAIAVRLTPSGGER